MAYNIFKENILALEVISFHSALKLSADIAMKSWQIKWELETAGYYTRQLIPEVGRKVIFPVDCDVDISYCRLLLNNTMLNDDANHTGAAQSPVCECGNERETVQHFLRRCPLYHEGRICMLVSIKGICASWKGKHTWTFQSFFFWHPLQSSNGCVSNGDKQIIKAVVL